MTANNTNQYSNRAHIANPDALTKIHQVSGEGKHRNPKAGTTAQYSAGGIQKMFAHVREDSSPSTPIISNHELQAPSNQNLDNLSILADLINTINEDPAKADIANRKFGKAFEKVIEALKPLAQKPSNGNVAPKTHSIIADAESDTPYSDPNFYKPEVR